jgi:hypothetical protein
MNPIICVSINSRRQFLGMVSGFHSTKDFTEDVRFVVDANHREV